jgi:hypothetical protein
MTVVWLGPNGGAEVDELLETVLEVAALRLVTLLDVAVLLLVVVLEVAAPPPIKRYPPTPATTKTTTIATAAIVVDMPVLERRTAQDPPRPGVMLGSSRSTILNSWNGTTLHLNP